LPGKKVRRVYCTRAPTGKRGVKVAVITSADVHDGQRPPRLCTSRFWLIIRGSEGSFLFGVIVRKSTILFACAGIAILVLGVAAALSLRAPASAHASGGNQKAASVTVTTGTATSKAATGAVATTSAAARNGTTEGSASGSASADGDEDGPLKEIRFASHPEMAPPFMINDLTGKPISSASFPGKVVLISFWATWCPPCRLEIPELIDLANRYKDQVEIVGISMDDPEDVAKVQSFVTKMGMNYPVAMGTKDLVDEYGGVPALPTVFVLNKEGRVVQKHMGLMSTELYDTEIRSLLGMPVNVKVEAFDDKGQIFLKNATELPDVDMSRLTEAQKKAALKRMNSETCTCGCGLTVAECRINDESCDVSKGLAAQIVKDVSGKGGKTPDKSPSPDEVIHH
jgi:thiol-disulfide isomerase/thioredoxin